MKSRVYVTLKPAILDPQGQAVAQALRRMGFAEVNDVRVGRFIEVDIAGDSDERQAALDQMCQRLLANPVIEDFRVEHGHEE
jgi:phosphoribosylformylglycinamidine synthase